jgi:predicted anti-sigma-YlaC factor YlaD
MRLDRPCAEVHELLEAFYDGELDIDERIDVQQHVNECAACNAAAADIAMVGMGLRDLASHVAEHDTTDATQISRTVLERIRVEELFSMRAQIADWFSDMHLVWAGLGASVATLICIVGSASVLHATNQERPNSMARAISELATQGSNDNPLRLNSSIKVPRAVTDAIDLSERDAQYTLTVVVSREGDVQGVEMVDQAMHPGVNAMLNEAYRTKFAPATAGGDAVAVSLVWLVTNTTVKSPYDPMEALRLALRLRNSPEPIATPTVPEAAEPKPIPAQMMKPTAPEANAGAPALGFAAAAGL